MIFDPNRFPSRQEMYGPEEKRRGLPLPLAAAAGLGIVLLIVILIRVL